MKSEKPTLDRGVYHAIATYNDGSRRFLMTARTITDLYKVSHGGDFDAHRCHAAVDKAKQTIEDLGYHDAPNALRYTVNVDRIIAMEVKRA